MNFHDILLIISVVTSILTLTINIKILIEVVKMRRDLEILHNGIDVLEIQVSIPAKGDYRSTTVK